MASDRHEFEAYSYRVGARFGGRVRIAVADGTVTVTGPRIGVGIYRAWIAVQVLLEALVLPVLAVGLARRRWRLVLAAFGLAGAHGAVGGVGAVSLWEMASLIAFGEGKPGDSVSFPVSAVRDVRIGAGWARHGLALVILPYVKGVDAAAEGLAVSFEAPDGVKPGDSVYALHMRSPEEADALARLLRGAGPAQP